MLGRLSSLSVLFVILFVSLTNQPSLAAVCPVKLRSIVFAAQASSHAFVSYALRLDGAPETGTDVAMSLALDDGKHVDVPWSDVTIEKPQRHGESTTAYGTLDRATADVVSASIDAVSPAPGQTPVPCDSPTVQLNAVDNEPWGFEVVNALKHAFNPTVANVPTDHHKATDASFVSKVSPPYPPAEKGANIQGAVTVRIVVGTDGTVTHANVLDSSQDDGLDAAALDAARSSTFKPATLDGVAVSADYLIVYTFFLTDQDQPGSIPGVWDLPPPKFYCPLTARTMALDNARDQKGPDWYSIFLDASRTDIVSAELEFFDAAGVDVVMHWDSISMPVPDSDGISHVQAAIAWTGDDPKKVWVADVKFANGRQQNCRLHYEIVDRDDSAARLPRSLSQQSPVAVQMRRFEAPVVESYPTYPPAALAADVTGRVGIDAIVNDAGTVTGALVVSSSKSADLDASALSAAMKTKFAQSDGKDDESPVRVFHLEYDFTDSP